MLLCKKNQALRHPIVFPFLSPLFSPNRLCSSSLHGLRGAQTPRKNRPQQRNRRGNVDRKSRKSTEMMKMMKLNLQQNSQNNYPYIWIGIPWLSFVKNMGFTF